MKRCFTGVSILLLSILISSCQNPLEGAGAGQATDLKESDPSSQGVDPARLAGVDSLAGQMDYLASLIVVRNGAVILERYYHGSDRSTAFNVKSVSKSFVSALTGVAIKEGFISGLDQKVAEFFPEYFEAGDDPRKKEINLRHLLTMTSGLEWTENGPIVQDWVYSSNWVRFALDRPLAHKPGEAFNYTTAGTHVLSAVITRATKMSALEFGNKYLFRPAGIRVARWDSDPQGNNFGGAEMYLTARDLAKFGLLYLNLGSAGGVQLVPEDWVRESTRIQMNLAAEPGKEGYGYMWWAVTQSRGIYIYYAAGYGGQYIFNVPELNLVVVSTSTLADSPDLERINKHRTSILKLLDNQIISSVIR